MAPKVSLEVDLSTNVNSFLRNFSKESSMSVEILPKREDIVPGEGLARDARLTFKLENSEPVRAVTFCALISTCKTFRDHRTSGIIDRCAMNCSTELEIFLAHVAGSVP